MTTRSLSSVGLLISGVFAGCMSNALGQSDLVEAVSSAKPLTIVAPTFPKNKSAPAPGIRVDVVGTVLTTGEFKPESITNENTEQDYVDAVSDALKWWRFIPAIDREQCAPRDEKSKLSIWFEGSDITPKVFFSFPPSSAQLSPQRLVLDSLSAPKVTYPLKLIEMEGQVQVVYLFSSEGELKSVKIRSSTPYGAFDSVVLAAAKRTRISWKEPKPKGDVCATRTYLFCMQSQVSLPFEGCRNK